MIAATVVASREAKSLQWLLQLLPIAFVFRARANHEYAELAGMLLAIYATERSRRFQVRLHHVLSANSISTAAASE